MDNENITVENGQDEWFNFFGMLILIRAIYGKAVGGKCTLLFDLGYESEKNLVNVKDYYPFYIYGFKNCVGKDISYIEKQVYEMHKAVSNALDTLTPRERTVLISRFGLKEGWPKSLESTGSIFGVLGERIRQIEAKALRKLRSPIRSKFTKKYLEYASLSTDLEDHITSFLALFVRVDEKIDIQNLENIDNETLKSIVDSYLDKDEFNKLCDNIFEVITSKCSGKCYTNYKIGSQYYILGRYERSLACFNKSVENDGLIAGYFSRGYLLDYKMNDKNSAIDDYKAVLDYDKEYRHYSNGRFYYYKKNHYKA